MSADLIARGLALQARPFAGLASDLAATRIAATAGVVSTSGYGAAGKGAGSYASDSLANAALAAAHPRFCKQSADGRYWRLLPVGSAITVEQGGAAGDNATNDQPACQAAIAYANAVGATTVGFASASYALWAPLRANGLSPYDGAGNYLVTRENVLLRGVRGRSRFSLFNSAGGSNNTVTQTVDGAAWRGSFFYAWPNTAIDWVSLEDIEVDGGHSYVFGVNGVVDNLCHGFRAQDATVSRIFLRNVTMRNFKGEIYYNGALPGYDEVLENCTFDGSPQCAFNPAGCGTGTYLNLQAGNAYIAMEIVGGKGRTFIGGRFYDASQVSVLGGAAGDGSFHSGYFYSYPWRDAAKAPPWVLFDGTRFERTGTVNLFGSYVRGKIETIDTPVDLINSGKQSDIDLEIEGWSDAATRTHVASINSAMQTATTQVPNCPAGIFYDTPRNIRVAVRARRTAAGVAGGFKVNRLFRVFGGLYDSATLSFILTGEADAPVDIIGTVPASFVWPLVVTDDGFRAVNPPDFGAFNGIFPAANSNLTLYPGPNFVQPLTAGTISLTLVNTYPFQTGQKARIWHTGGAAQTDRFFKLARSGAGAVLPEDRTAYQYGDFIDLRWDATRAGWLEDGYTTQQALRLKGSATYDAPSIAAGGSTTTTVTVTGAALGDRVDRISFGISQAGLVASGYVSAANTVTVVLQNPTGAAVDLASTTLSVEVTK